HLLRGHAPVGDLDALHARRVPKRVRALEQLVRVGQRPVRRPVMPLAVVVALAIDAPAQARLGEKLVVHLALFLELDGGLEGVDLVGPCRRHAVLEKLLPGTGSGLGHGEVWPVCETEPGKIAITSYSEKFSLSLWLFYSVMLVKGEFRRPPYSCRQ